MRKFTKTHNDLKWLFPIAKTKKEAEEVFNYVEEQAKDLADIAGVNEADKDLAIDCFMKGYSYCMQLEIHREVEKAINRIYRNLFNIKKDYGKDKHPEEWKKYFRFYKLEDLFRHLAWDSKDEEAKRKYLVSLLEKSAFDNDEGSTEKREEEQKRQREAEAAKRKRDAEKKEADERALYEKLKAKYGDN